jgi:hypothetical protein
METWNLDEFGAGLAFGAVASGLLLVAYLAGGVGQRRPLRLAGVVMAAGGLWSVAHTLAVPKAVVLGVVGIGAVAATASLPWISRWHGVALAVPFAWAIGFHGDVVAVLWAQLLVTVVASGGAILATAFDHAWREEAPGITLLVVTAVGMYATVPDTEAVAAAVGVVLPFLVLGWPLRVATLGRPGAAATIAMLVWAGAVGSRGRPASIIGLVACLGLLVGNPLGRVGFPRLGVRLRGWPRQALILAMAASHALLVIAAARVAGQVSDTALAAVIGAVVAVAAIYVGAHFRPPALLGTD